MDKTVSENSIKDEENDEENDDSNEESSESSENNNSLSEADFEESAQDSNESETRTSINSIGDDSTQEANTEGLIENGKLPFPRATITNLVRKNLSKGKQIKGTVKDEMNLWVNKMVERIAKKMNSQQYTFVNYDMLKEAIAPYDDIQNIDKQREGLVKKINSIKAECESVISQIDLEPKQKSISLKIETDELPFPKATITNKLRKYLDERKTIKGPVKRGLNVWLGILVERVSSKMNSYPYPYIDRSMFKESIEPYEAVGEIEVEKERIIQQMESMKTICDLLVMEVERKFKL